MRELYKVREHQTPSRGYPLVDPEVLLNRPDLRPDFIDLFGDTGVGASLTGAASSIVKTLQVRVVLFAPSRRRLMLASVA